MYIEFVKLRIYPAAIVFTSMIGSVMSPVYAAEKPYQKKFVVTAYYSALPDQCCYFRGSYEEEIMFNGKGKNGADGTPVYPGMIAAPATYPFGTVISIPGIGVGKVHDRGSRIIEWGDDIHRIDVWMGYGEEGLARALAFGTRQITGTVYPADFDDSPREGIILENLPAKSETLEYLPKTDTFSILVAARFGVSDYSARMLQQLLKENGYFDHAVTGQFGPVTRDSMKAFISDFNLVGDGESVSKGEAAALISAAEIKPENLPDLFEGLGIGDRGENVRQLQKLLRHLGFYRGRTDGVFDLDVKSAVLAFQLKYGIVKQSLDLGSGRVGPVTRSNILKAWKARQVALKSKKMVIKNQIAVSRRNNLPAKTLAKGDHSPEVKTLQQILKKLGYLKNSEITSNYGERTKQAVLGYQLDRKIVTSQTQRGAGVFGPATRKALLSDVVEADLKKLRTVGPDGVNVKI